MNMHTQTEHCHFLTGLQEIVQGMCCQSTDSATRLSELHACAWVENSNSYSMSSGKPSLLPGNSFTERSQPQTKLRFPKLQPLASRADTSRELEHSGTTAAEEEEAAAALTSASITPSNGDDPDHDDAHAHKDEDERMKRRTRTGTTTRRTTTRRTTTAAAADTKNRNVRISIGSRKRTRRRYQGMCTQQRNTRKTLTSPCGTTDIKGSINYISSMSDKALTRQLFPTTTTSTAEFKKEKISGR